jgi:hypothetical protein
MSSHTTAPSTAEPVARAEQVAHLHRAAARSSAAASRPVHFAEVWNAMSHSVHRITSSCEPSFLLQPPHASARMRKARRQSASSTTSAGGMCDAQDVLSPCSGAQLRQHHDPWPEELNAFASPSPQQASVAWNHAAHESQFTPHSTVLRQAGQATRSAAR